MSLTWVTKVTEGKGMYPDVVCLLLNSIVYNVWEGYNLVVRSLSVFNIYM